MNESPRYTVQVFLDGDWVKYVHSNDLDAAKASLRRIARFWPGMAARVVRRPTEIRAGYSS